VRRDGERRLDLGPFLTLVEADRLVGLSAEAACAPIVVVDGSGTGLSCSGGVGISGCSGGSSGRLILKRFVVVNDVCDFGTNSLWRLHRSRLYERSENLEHFNGIFGRFDVLIHSRICRRWLDSRQWLFTTRFKISISSRQTGLFFSLGDDLDIG
jgi:hypothetical protein